MASRQKKNVNESTEIVVGGVGHAVSGNSMLHEDAVNVIYMYVISRSGPTRKYINLFDAVVYMQKCRPHKRFSVGCSSLFMRRVSHGAYPLVKAMSSSSVKARHAPSRHCMDARIYGHTAKAIHDNETLSHAHCRHTKYTFASLSPPLRRFVTEIVCPHLCLYLESLFCL